MKIENTTDFPDYFLRRMTSWCLKQHECPVRELKTATFRNRTTGRDRSGRCRGWAGEIICSVTVHGTVDERINILVGITAHETGHIANWHEGNTSRRSRRYGGVVSHGGSEAVTCRMERRVYNTFTERRDELIAAWMTPPARIARAAASGASNGKPSVRDKRAANARKRLDQWERKLKRAQTAVKKWRTKVQYYDRVTNND